MEAIQSQGSKKYSQELEEWKKVEVIHDRILKTAERERAERWKRELATHLSNTDSFKKNGSEGEGEGSDEGEAEEGEVVGEGEVEGEKGSQTGHEETDPRLDGHAHSRATSGEREGEGEGEGDGVVGGSRSLLPDDESSDSVTPVPMKEHAILDTGPSPPSHTPSTSTPPLTPPSPQSQNSAPETSTLSDLSLLTESTSSPLHSSQSSQHYIISPQNDIITKTRSSSVDSGHSSNCNLGNSINSSHGNGPVNGFHSDGESSMEHGQEGACVSNEVTLTVVGDSAEGEEGEEGEGEMELDEKGRRFADELSKIDKDIPRCDRDYW